MIDEIIIHGRKTIIINNGEKRSSIALGFFSKYRLYKKLLSFGNKL
jgi:hypothetical protein